MVFDYYKSCISFELYFTVKDKVSSFLVKKNVHKILSLIEQVYISNLKESVFCYISFSVIIFYFRYKCIQL